jgi:hypothetical protein
MSNNQKAVKYNPSDSKNVIQFALLRHLSKVLIFLIFITKRLTQFQAYCENRKARAFEPAHPSELNRQATP